MSTKTLMSVEEFQQLPDDGNRYEYNRGVLTTMPPPKHGHDELAQNINSDLTPFLHKNRLGRVYTEKSYELDGPQLTQRPDVSFLRADRVKNTPADSYVQGSPDLAVEIISPSNHPDYVDEKLKEYFAYGAHAVWVLYPKSRRVYQYRSPRDVQILGEGETLSEPDLFRSWEMAVSRIFEQR